MSSGFFHHSRYRFRNKGEHQMACASLGERPTELPSLTRKFPSLLGRLYVGTWQVMQIQIMQEVSQRTLATDALDHAVTECHRAFPSPISLGKRERDQLPDDVIKQKVVATAIRHRVIVFSSSTPYSIPKFNNC